MFDGKMSRVLIYFLLSRYPVMYCLMITIVARVPFFFYTMKLDRISTSKYLRERKKNVQVKLYSSALVIADEGEKRRSPEQSTKKSSILREKESIETMLWTAISFRNSLAT
jgi:hypothetical protein